MPDTNVTGTLELLHHLLPGMVQARAGRVLITGSIAGFITGPGLAAHNASKALLNLFAQSLREELRDTGVTVTCLQPGATDTPIFDRAGLGLSPIGRQSKDDPAEVAEAGFRAAMAGGSRRRLSAWRPGNGSPGTTLSNDRPGAAAYIEGNSHVWHSLSCWPRGHRSGDPVFCRHPLKGVEMENKTSSLRPAPSAVAGGATSGSYVDWAAILGGSVLAVALVIIFSGFGAALGLTAISAERGEGSGTLALFLSAGWIILSMIAAYALGGYVAGRMRRRLDAASSDEIQVRDGLNGLVVWAVATLLSAMVLGSAVSSTVSAVGSVAGTAAEAAGAAVGGVAEGAASALVPDGASADPLGFVTGTLLRPTAVAPGSASTPETASDAGAILSNIVTTGEISDSDRAYLVSLTAARTGLSEPEVNARVDQAIATARNARQQAADLAAQAEETARQVAETARISAILTAFMLASAALVAAVVAYKGAVRGGRHRDEGRIFGGLASRW